MGFWVISVDRSHQCKKWLRSTCDGFPSIYLPSFPSEDCQSGHSLGFPMSWSFLQWVQVDFAQKYKAVPLTFKVLQGNLDRSRNSTASWPVDIRLGQIFPMISHYPQKVNISTEPGKFVPSIVAVGVAQLWILVGSGKPSTGKTGLGDLPEHYFGTHRLFEPLNSVWLN